MRSASPKYEENKFIELMLYVAFRCETNPRFGATKLNKILFYSDFVAYRELGKPITGAVYQKLRHGPAPVMLVPVRKALIKSGAAAIRSVPVVPGDLSQDRLITLRPVNLKIFTPEEISIVDSVIEVFEHHTAREASDFSHEFGGWACARYGEEIPYFTVHLAEIITELDEEDRAWAAKTIKALGGTPVATKQ